MNQNEKFELLRQQGDPIERRICLEQEALSAVIFSYANAWADFVYPNRQGDGSTVTLKWMPFAGSHYSALVRLFQAYRAKLHLGEMSSQLASGIRDADLLIEAHAATAAFWENLGSCIDNLALAFEDTGLIERLGDAVDERVEGSGGRKQLKLRYPKVAEAYDRRTQFIHSRLVPQKIQDGALVFNVRLLQTKETYWPSEHGIEDEFVEDFHDQFWLEFLVELGDVWGNFYRLLRDKYGAPADASSIPLPKADWSQLKPGDINITVGPIHLSSVRVPSEYGSGPPPSG